MSQVYNVLPSISAITGISPQRYLWRISIALHIGPRLVIATVYHSYYRKILNSMEDVSNKILGCRLLNLCFWLNIAEIAALSGVTYISNRENYCEFIFFLQNKFTMFFPFIVYLTGFGGCSCYWRGEKSLTNH